MQKKNRIELHLLILMGFVLLFANSCKDDELPPKKIPVITWANPVDITSETWLSSTQLNATANVSGSFVYTPAIDTRLNVGTNQVLKVVFTPTDIATYDTISKSVMVNVIQATTLKDIDQNVYNIVVIGSQTWLTQNLKTTKYNDGSLIPLITDNSEWINLTSAGYCWSEDDASNRTLYGAFYNWYAVNTGKLAPKGWHVPTEADWIKLQNHLGGASVSGGKLKETGTAHWDTPNTGATNESGFLALPGGYRSKANGTVPTKYQNAVWWSSTGSINSFGRFIVNYNSNASDYQNDSGAFGFSVRCIRD